MSQAIAPDKFELVARSESLELVYPSCNRGLGDLISATDSAKLIDGVKLQASSLWPDDRGYFLEVLRVGHGLAGHFPTATTQVSTALSHPGIIKAFHFHLHQTDCWAPSVGMLQVALADLRRDSPTFGQKNTIYVGALRPWQILIPPGVAHGYKVISLEPAVLVYVTDHFYNPKDEGRIPHNDPRINYDWELQHK